MGRKPCCGDDEAGAVKKGPWTTEEDRTLVDYIRNNGGHGSWRRLPRLAGLNRCGKSCRLRWTNYLRPDIKRGGFTDDDDKLIIHLHSLLGNKWSAIAARLPGRTDNEIKNYWNTHLRKKLLAMGIDPVTHRPHADLALIPSLLKLQADAANLANLHLLQGLLTSVLGTAGAPASPQPLPNVDLMALLGAALLATGGGGQYDGLSNLQALTSAAAPTMPELVLDGFGIGATTGLGDATDLAELGQGASCGNMTMPVAAAAPALVETLPDSCTVGGGGTDMACSSPASSSFEGLEQSLSYLDELRADGGCKDLLEQMSLFNSPQYEDI